MVRTIAKDHDEKCQHILKISAKVFAREGIARASMNEVAKACGISKANIYHYYASKNDLLFDILDSYLSKLRQLLCEVDLNHLGPEAQLHFITREFLMAYEGMDHEHKIQSEGLSYLEEDRQQILKNYQRDLVKFVGNILKNCSPEVLGNDPVRCKDVTMSVFGMLNWFYMWNPKTSKEMREQYATLVAELTLHGIVAKPH